MERATEAVEYRALDDPRLLGEALILLADTRDECQEVKASLRNAAPYAAIGEAVTTPSMSVSLRNALDIVREVRHVPMVDFCETLRRYGWVKLTPRDNTHRPTRTAIKAGYVERVYYKDNRGYKPAITPTGVEILKYAYSTGKFDSMKI